MPGEITMPQLSDTMSEGVVVKWHRKEGEKIREGEKIADVETDKAVMEMESFETGTLAAVLIPEGQKVKVGTVLAVVARAGEDVEAVKKQYLQKAGLAGGGSAAGSAAAASGPAAASSAGAAASGVAVRPIESVAQPPPPKEKPYYQFDLVVIGGGPAGYAGAIRAGQLRKRVLCVEKENLGGTCLNWGCIPTKALLENAALVRKVREHAGEFGLKVSGLEVDFGKIIARSRGIADKLSKGIAHLFRKYEVKSETGTAQVLGPHKVRITHKDGSNREVTAEHILIATGAKPRSLPGIDFDGKVVVSSREAMTLPSLPKRLAIIGAGAIGCEFADFYSSLGTQVTIIEVMDHLLPIEDKDCSVLLERVFTKRGIQVMTRSKVEKLVKHDKGATLTVATQSGPVTVEADVVLQAVGVTGNIDGLFAPGVNVELHKGHIKVELGEYRTSLEDVWAVGDVIGPPWLAHVAHHEAVKCVEKIFGPDGKGNGHVEPIDYAAIPGCTYTHPQVASLGLTEAKAREQGREIRVGKFPFQASGRALAAGETDGFVKLIFDAKYGELLGVHMIGENVTELLSELIVAKKLEATEEEILEAMHPHPTLSEAIMEAAGVAAGRAIHL
ncbi:MAG: dihydrolipoyl dehydrogenase [Tepidisphaerales bacterium]